MPLMKETDTCEITSYMRGKAGIKLRFYGSSNDQYEATVRGKVLEAALKDFKSMWLTDVFSSATSVLCQLHFCK